MNFFELMLNTLSYFIITIMAIFVIVNPLTTAFVFPSLLPRASEKRRINIAMRFTKISTAVFFVLPSSVVLYSSFSVLPWRLSE